MKTKNQNGYLAIFISLVCISANAYSQNLEIPDQLPSVDLQSRDPHQYQVVTEYRNYDLFGNPSGGQRFDGKYSIGLADGKVKWEDVSQTAWSSNGTEKVDRLLYMDGFQYSYQQDLLSPEFFSSFPVEAVEAKNLVWDMAALEFFSWGNSDRLELNRPFRAEEANQNFDLAGLGHFENRDVVLCWIGMTVEDGRSLALIEYRTLSNPLSVEMDMGARHFSTKGRSHYWGTVWLDLKDRCIHRAKLYEDVVMEIGFDDQPAKQQIDVVREITVSKI